MVKNTGGNKTKKQKRNFGRYDAVNKVEQGQMFAKIIHNNGGSFSVMCSDGIPRLGKLSGEMKKGPRLSEGSFVVVSLREFESEQKHCDIIAHGAPPSDVMNIFKKNEPNSSKKVPDIEFVESDDEFKDFEESNRTAQPNTQNAPNAPNAPNTSNSNTGPNTQIDWDDL